MAITVVIEHLETTLLPFAYRIQLVASARTLSGLCQGTWARLRWRTPKLWLIAPMAADDFETLSMTRPQQIDDQRRANKARLDNRWGCSVGYALRSFNPQSRFDAHSRPSGASA